MLTHITVCMMQCQKGAQKGEDELTTSFRCAKSQKPSPVSGEFEFNFVKKNYG